MKKINTEKLTTMQLAAFIAGGAPPRDAVFPCPVSPGELAAMSPEELKEAFPDTDPDGLTRLSCALELCRRTAAEKHTAPKIIKNSSDAYYCVRERLSDLKQEHFTVLTLDAAGKVTSETTVSVGTLTSSMAHARDVFRTAVIKNAHSVILAHNHPSGDPSPSDEDIKVTSALAEAGKVIGIRVTDHIIVGDGSYFSFTDSGLIVL